jgi:hypothetical protein
MPPRKRKHDDVMGDYNDLLDDILASTSQRDTVNKIRRFQRSHDDYARQTIAPTEFELDDAISAFGLNYDTTYSASERRGWAIEEVPETKGFQPSHCLSEPFSSLKTPLLIDTMAGDSITFRKLFAEL